MCLLGTSVFLRKKIVGREALDAVRLCLFRPLLFSRLFENGIVDIRVVDGAHNFVGHPIY